MVCNSDKHDKSSGAGFSCSAQVEFRSLAIVKNNGRLAPWLYADRVYQLCKVADKQPHRKSKEEFSFESHKRNWFSEWGIHLKREDCKHFNSYGLNGKSCKGGNLYIDKLQHCGPLLFIVQQHLLMDHSNGTTKVDWWGLREALKRIRDGEPKSTERGFFLWFQDTFAQAFVNEVT